LNILKKKKQKILGTATSRFGIAGNPSGSKQSAAAAQAGRRRSLHWAAIHLRKAKASTVPIRLWRPGRFYSAGSKPSTRTSSSFDRGRQR